jgi:multidrug transporter EmrE-like cation transporter
MFNTESLRYGLGMAALDVTTFPIVKYVSMGLDPVWMIIPMFLYAFEPLILLKSLTHESLTVMNIMWDLMSVVLVTCMGLFYFNEKISLTKICGVILSIISIGLLTYEG